MNFVLVRRGLIFEGAYIWDFEVVTLLQDLHILPLSHTFHHFIKHLPPYASDVLFKWYSRESTNIILFINHPLQRGHLSAPQERQSSIHDSTKVLLKR